MIKFFKKMWKVPLFDVDFDREELRAASRVINSGWLSAGEVTADFERQFAQFIGTRFAIAVSSCTAALHLVNQAFGISNQDEVICPGLTFVAGPNSILYTGAKPIFADIVSSTELNISPLDIERKITKRTKAIQVMHYAGFPCRMDDIMAIAKSRKIKVVEDCAHAVGSLYRRKRCGALSDAGCFSFFPNKNMTTGEGGMITTNNYILAKKLRLLRSHGMSRMSLVRHLGHAFSYNVVSLGYNYRIDELRSGIGIAQLRKLTKNNQRRKEISSLYRKRLGSCTYIDLVFSDDPGSAHHIFPILLKNQRLRHRLMEYMNDQGIQTSIHYPLPYRFSYYKSIVNSKAINLEFCEYVSSREITLPLYPSMTVKQIYYVCDKLESFFA